MRADMSKVLVERPRPTSEWNKPGLYRNSRKFKSPIEDAPAKESMTRRYKVHGNDKMFNENLAPLKRFLGSNVWRPWNKIYSEMSAQVNRGNPVQKHIFTHLLDYVALHIEMQDGELWVKGRWGRLQLLEESNYHFYVDAHGLLRINKWIGREEMGRRFQVRYPRHKPVVHFTLQGREGRTFAELQVADGSRQWFEVQLARIESADDWDVLFRRAIGVINHEIRKAAYGEINIYSATKRPLGSREIRDLQLSNSSQR